MSKCWAYKPNDENNCHFSMFVRRKCDPDHCPDKGDFTGEAEVMNERVIHAVTSGRKGKWVERDPPSSEQMQKTNGSANK